MSNRPSAESGATSVWKVVVRRRQRQQLTLERCGAWPAALPSARLYFLRGLLRSEQVHDICTRLLCDPVAEQFEILAAGQPETIEAVSIDILPRPGVMDPAAASACQAMRELGHAVDEVKTGRRHSVGAGVAAADLPALAWRLSNPLVEEAWARSPGERPAVADPFVSPPPAAVELRTVQLRAADAEGLLALSRDGHLFLNLEEMQAIQAHYLALGRDPTDIELETLAQTWSEHCVHKTLKSAIDYRGPGFPEVIDLTGCGPVPSPPIIERRYDNLLADTIMTATRRLDRPWCWSVFSDNAGIIAFDDRWGVAFKVETHNHPSALEPYGGAATGIGGCIRDILGCGLGARPVAATDVFCFASPELAEERVPAGLFHPRRSLREVVRGVRDYGNRMGIPTVNGAICFDDRFLGNPLVFCGCVGLIPRERVHKEVRAGDRILVLGGRTGRDGIHGATFSSGSMSGAHAEKFAHAVQIGNAITEKKVLDVLLQARDAPGGPLYRSVTDCGAGGLSSAVGELGARLGAVVELDRVPLKYAGLRYDEIWISTCASNIATV